MTQAKEKDGKEISDLANEILQGQISSNEWVANFINIFIHAKELTAFPI